MSFEFFISRRFLKLKKKQAFISLISLLSILGVMVGVMALIIVIAVMTGFESDLKSRILGVESHIILMRYGGEFSEYTRTIEYLKKMDGIEAATPFVYSQGMVRSSSSISGAVIRGIDPETASQVIKALDEKILQRLSQQNSTPEDHSTPKIILGKELANHLRVIRGDSVYLISPRGMISPMGHLPSMKRFEVAGFFESGMYEYDGSLAYIHLKDAQKILHMGENVTGIEIRVHNIYDAKRIADNIVKELGFPFWAKDWMQMNQNLFSALKLEKTVMFIILVLIVLVAAFNIASTLIMMVMEKTKDIAILKAMGATDRSIRKIFVLNGMAIGCIGTSLGVLFGYILCMLLKKYKFIELPADVYYISTLPVKLQWGDVMVIACSALIICFVATLYPARKASKLNPVEAIRYG